MNDERTGLWLRPQNIDDFNLATSNIDSVSFQNLIEKS
jgi:hypothetical protein